MPPPFTSFTSFSVRGAQNCFRFRVLEYVLAQQVVLLCASFSQTTITKAEMTKSIEAGRDAQRVRRQLAFEAILTSDINLGVMPWCHIKATVVV